MISLILIIIAAICNAVMDVLENENFHTSIFMNKNQRFWYKRESWKYAKMIGGYRLDAWHLFKSAMVVLLITAIVFYSPMYGWIDFIIYGIAWNIVFNFFYNNVL